MGIRSKRLTGKRVWNVIAKVPTHSSAALCAAAKTGAGVAAQVGTMTATVAKNLASRRGNIPAIDLFGKIPQGVRLAGEKSILEYLKKVDLSHIRSVTNSPSLTNNVDNVLFEYSALNRARVGRDMTAVEVAKAKASGAIVGLEGGLRAVPKSALRSGLMAVALELPVSGAVNLIRYQLGGLSGKQAAINITKDALKTSVAGAALGGGVVVAGALGAPAIGSAMVVVSIIGIPVYVVSSGLRIYTAATEKENCLVAG